jgi:hypothetical protein
MDSLMLFSYSLDINRTWRSHELIFQCVRSLQHPEEGFQSLCEGNRCHLMIINERSSRTTKCNTFEHTKDLDFNTDSLLSSAVPSGGKELGLS